MVNNVKFSFKHEYRRLTLLSRCDVTNGGIKSKQFFCDNLSDVKMERSEIFWTFQNIDYWAIFTTIS